MDATKYKEWSWYLINQLESSTCHHTTLRFIFWAKMDTFECFITTLETRILKIQMKIKGKMPNNNRLIGFISVKLGGHFYESLICFEVARIDFKPDAKILQWKVSHSWTICSQNKCQNFIIQQESEHAEIKTEIALKRYFNNIMISKIVWAWTQLSKSEAYNLQIQSLKKSIKDNKLTCEPEKTKTKSELSQMFYKVCQNKRIIWFTRDEARCHYFNEVPSRINFDVF